MSKEINLQQTADKLFASTKHTVLYGVASCNEFFTSENSANNACKKGEKPVKFQKKTGLPKYVNPPAPPAKDEKQTETK